MTAILEHAEVLRQPVQADPTTLIVLNTRSVLFVRPSKDETWRLPMGIVNPETLALEACCSSLQDKVGATVQVLGAHTTDEAKRPLDTPIAVAEISHWAGRPSCKEGEETAKWVRLADGNFTITEDQMVFSPRTADVLSSALKMVRRKKGINTSAALEKIESAIRQREVTTESAA